MSFHLHRLSNKLFKTKLPTSTYQSHYSFKARRYSKEEVFQPKVQMEEEVTSEPIVQKAVIYSNWRRMANLPKYEYPESNTFWVRLGILLCYPAILYYETVTKPDHDVISAQANMTWGVADAQNSLDVRYED